MKSNGLFLFLMVLCCGLVQFARAETAPSVEIAPSADTEVSDIFYMCKNTKGSARWLRAYRIEGGKCHTVYSKEGYLQVISSATYMTSCEGVLHNVRKNIEEGGYKCSKLESYSYLEVE